MASTTNRTSWLRSVVPLLKTSIGTSGPCPFMDWPALPLHLLMRYMRGHSKSSLTRSARAPGGCWCGPEPRVRQRPLLRGLDRTRCRHDSASSSRSADNKKSKSAEANAMQRTCGSLANRHLECAYLPQSFCRAIPSACRQRRHSEHALGHNVQSMPFLAVSLPTPKRRASRDCTGIASTQR